jgi:hypothetical protein
VRDGFYLATNQSETRLLKNPYKRTDIFVCLHESHHGFKNKISTYHILKEKQCFPQGCFYFLWRCKQLSKRSKCHRGYSHVGRKCFGCKDYYEEKIHNYPQLRITKEEYQNFIKEMDYFEDWLGENQNRDLEIAGTVSGVKPHFIRKVYPKANYLSFKGYILIFKEIFVGMERMEDPVYATISGNYFRRLRLGKGCRIEGLARLKTDRGRLILHHLKRIEIMSRGEDALWSEQSAMVAKETATEFFEQPEECVQCPYGALIDVEYLKDHHTASSRSLFCLKGVRDYKDCYVRAEYCGMDREAYASPTQNCVVDKKVFIP